MSSRITRMRSAGLEIVAPGILRLRNFFQLLHASILVFENRVHNVRWLIFEFVLETTFAVDIADAKIVARTVIELEIMRRRVDVDISPNKIVLKPHNRMKYQIFVFKFRRRSLRVINPSGIPR